MLTQEFGQGNILSTKQVSRQIGGMKLSEFLSMPENEFADLIRKIENESLFKQLMYPKNKAQKVISYKRFPGTDLSSKFYEFSENIAINNPVFDIGSFLEEKNKIIPIIKKLDIDKFKQYFLYNDDIIPDEEIAGKCELTIPDTRRIKDFVDEFFIHTEFYQSSAIPAVSGIHYSKIASVEKDTSDNCTIGYFSLSLAKGRYSVDYERLKKFKQAGLFSKEENHKIDKLLRKLELINSRKTAIYEVIQHIVETQTEYLKSSDQSKINSFTQKEIANKLNVHPSIICRAIKYKSIEMPWGEEKPLKFFFSNRKKETQDIIQNIVNEEKEKLRKGIISRAYSDKQIRNRLEKDYKIKIARRTVSEYRKELQISSSIVRMRETYINISIAKRVDKVYRKPENQIFYPAVSRKKVDFQ